jgi:very-short-patch-repair endonuclease
MKHLPYNKNLKQFSRDLRNYSTLSEILLWNELKAGKMMGYKFNRQKPLLNYIVDFYCKPLGLVIEVDGESHSYYGADERDLKRQIEIESLGLKFSRFDDLEMKNDINKVLRTIEEFIREFEQRNQIPLTPFGKGNNEEWVTDFEQSIFLSRKEQKY